MPAAPVLRKLVADARLPIGCWQFVHATEVTEMIGEAGFDFVILDSEHGGRGLDALTQCIVAADAVGLATIVRVQDNEQHLIERALDAGAQGILVPTVESVADAQRIVRAARFHPLGERGFSPMSRAGRFMNRRLVDAAAQEVMVAAMIETPKALAILDELLAVDGIDAWMLGPGDLSLRMGAAPADAAVQERVEDAFTRIAKAGKIGIAASGTMDRMHALGARMFVCADDVTVLMNGLRSQRSSFAEAFPTKAR